MPRYKITVEYDGTGLCGWQKQNDAPSIQQHLQEAVKKFCGEEIAVIASGRTDAGVHAVGQVAHFDISKKYKTYNVMHGINFYLDELSIKVVKAQIAKPDFNARFSAKRRYYRYHIINRNAPLALDKNRAWNVYKKLDVKAMKAASEFLLGEHDFTSFRASECQAKSPVKTLDEIKITKKGENIYFDITARSFLHHMVRNIVGSLKMVGSGDWQPKEIKKALEAKSRAAAGPTAPAYGLYLMKVIY